MRPSHQCVVTQCPPCQAVPNAVRAAVLGPGARGSWQCGWEEVGRRHMFEDVRERQTGLGGASGGRGVLSPLGGGCRKGSFVSCVVWVVPGAGELNAAFLQQ